MNPINSSTQNNGLDALNICLFLYTTTNTIVSNASRVPRNEITSNVMVIGDWYPGFMSTLSGTPEGIFFVPSWYMGEDMIFMFPAIMVPISICDPF